MKLIRKHNNHFVAGALALMLMLTACGGAEPEEKGGGGITGNANANSTDVCKYASRLEFPKLKGGNSIVIVNTTNDSYDREGVNYCVEWDKNKKSQRWSCYEMHSGYKVAGIERYYSKQNQYPFDPQLVTGATYLDKDYFYSSGFDHGHICPSADRLYSTNANYQTFFLTNMQPQNHTFNADVWGKLENQIRSWVTSGTTLYVCKGGTIDSETNILQRISGKLIVPKNFFCALLLKNNLGYKSIAFWYDQSKDLDESQPLSNFAISVDDLELRTDIDFFCNLPDATEEDRESRCDLQAWGLR